jgi:hypothetical protein
MIVFYKDNNYLSDNQIYNYIFTTVFGL